MSPAGGLRPLHSAGEDSEIIRYWILDACIAADAEDAIDGTDSGSF